VGLGQRRDRPSETLRKALVPHFLLERVQLEGLLYYVEMWFLSLQPLEDHAGWPPRGRLGLRALPHGTVLRERGRHALPLNCWLPMVLLRS
jgi:hypothetical protein